MFSIEKVVKYWNLQHINHNGANANSANVSTPYTEKGASNYMTYNGPASFASTSSGDSGPPAINNGNSSSLWDSNKQSLVHNDNFIFDQACQQLLSVTKSEFQQFEDSGTAQQNSLPIIFQPDYNTATIQQAAQTIPQPQVTSNSYSPLPLPAIPNISVTSHEDSCYDSEFGSNTSQRGSYNHESDCSGLTRTLLNEQNANSSFNERLPYVSNDQLLESTGTATNPTLTSLGNGHQHVTSPDSCNMAIYRPECSSQLVDNCVSLGPVKR